MLYHLKWLFLILPKLKRKYKGFYADRNVVISNNCLFSDYVCIFKNTILNNSKIGRFTYINGANCNNADIGAFCSIAPNVVIGSGCHPTNFLSTNPVFFSSGILTYSFNNIHYPEHKRTKIGNDVWIGYGAFISDGITIGNGAIIGAGAVVTKDVPAYSIVGGVPAKLIKMRFSTEAIAKINKLNWYDWSIEKLEENKNLFVQEINNYD